MPEECPWYAHSVPDRPQDTWQTLPEHLHGVARRAAAFAEAFGARQWGHAAGLLHDAGKYTEAFQRRLAGGAERVDHSTAGAKLAVDTMQPKNWGRALAYCIAGHHAGLPDGKQSGDPSCLTLRLRNAVLPAAMPDWLTRAAAPQALPFTQVAGRSGFQAAFFIRMLYSCLVDADFLDTEVFLEKGKHALREGHPPLEALWERLQEHPGKFKAKGKPSPVDPWRNAVLGWCLEAAGHAPGLFSLTVPTGGGKTLSSLAFALQHAVTHDLKRVIYVIPYTSIIEQNADVFREVADAFQFITSCYRPVLVPWDEEGEAIVAGLRHAAHAGKLARRAQRYTVQIPPWEFAALEADGALECVRERFFVLARMDRYDDEEGLFVDDGGAFRAEDWIQ